MLVKLSSKGQLVIPKPIREALGFLSGMQFQVRVDERKVILEPVDGSPADALYAKYAGADFLTELEEEHRQEVKGEASLCA